MLANTLSHEQVLMQVIQVTYLHFLIWLMPQISRNFVFKSTCLKNLFMINWTTIFHLSVQYADKYDSVRYLLCRIINSYAFCPRMYMCTCRAYIVHVSVSFSVL